jgi:hypothetical protein
MRCFKISTVLALAYHACPDKPGHGHGHSAGLVQRANRRGARRDEHRPDCGDITQK